MSRPTCQCPAYPFPHRPGGGLCCWPEPPAATWAGELGRNAATGMRRRSRIRRRLIRRYGWNPIADRERIKRWLPKLYVAHCRRHGLPYPEWWLGEYIPAMRVTASGRPMKSPAPLDTRSFSSAASAAANQPDVQVPRYKPALTPDTLTKLKFRPSTLSLQTLKQLANVNTKGPSK